MIYTTFGDCFYVENTFTASDEISIFKDPAINKYNGLFIASVINKNKYKYAFGRKAFRNKFKNDTIKLPVVMNDGIPKIDSSKEYSENGFVPDFDYMEEYIKTLKYSNKI